ncbi:MAG: cation transporter [Rhodospirillales bacterium]|nr:cation transporter [Rhodospirillales bacterium]
MSATCTHHAPKQAPEGAYRRVLWMVLVINASMCAVELAAGWQARSVSLQADALDFFGDAMTYIITLIVLGMGVRWRALAGLAKGIAMGLFGLWVLATTAARYFEAEPPAAEIMGAIGLLALVANLFSAYLLYKFRDGDSNKRSVWLCTRNDAIINIAVIGAGIGVWASQSPWPDLAVGAGIAILSLWASVSIIRQATGELKALPGHA